MDTKRNNTKIAIGVSMLVFFFVTLFVVLVVTGGWLVAMSGFVAAFLITVFITLAMCLMMEGLFPP